ncbi:MAG TPA: dual specificity protein phosphatase family protein [Thermomicrobiales bacterium]|nr:dual specificity protein phosphatase family protein [Thermomicrobiales bacterium]
MMHSRVGQERLVARTAAVVFTLFLAVTGLILLRRLTRTRPDRETWIREGILARSYPRRKPEIADLRRQGITVLVNLHHRPHDSAALASYGISTVHLPVRDFSAPSTDVLTSGILAIESARSRGECVCVHCGAGLGRTGTLLACYLVKTEGLSPADAIAEIRRLRPGAIETRGQERAVESFAGMKRS